MTDRSREIHPHQRYEDQRWTLRTTKYLKSSTFRRDIWMILTTIVVLYAITSIQQERARTTWVFCWETNERNIHAVNELDNLIRKLPPNRRARADAVRDSNVQLINALQPIENCDALAHDAVRGGLPEFEMNRMLEELDARYGNNWEGKETPIP